MTQSALHFKSLRLGADGGRIDPAASAFAVVIKESERHTQPCPAATGRRPQSRRRHETGTSAASRHRASRRRKHQPLEQDADRPGHRRAESRSPRSGLVRQQAVEADAEA